MGESALLLPARTLGEIKFIQECSRCHVMGPSITPDLRNLNDGMHAAFKDILLKGALAPAGMERFDDLLSEEDLDNIHAYLIDQSWIAYRAQQQKPPPQAQSCK
jgi:quinohemoprotein ethanol dehydrogenase